MLTLLLLAGIAFTAPGSETATDEQCIMCHVEIYDRALQDQYIHAPVFERQCGICHLAPGSKWPRGENVDLDINGLLVTQDLIWGKILPVSDDLLGQDHSANLTGLDSSAGYRFRLLIGEQPGAAGQINVLLGEVATLSELPWPWSKSNWKI